MGKASCAYRTGRNKPWRVRWYERVGQALEEREKSFADGLVAGAFRAQHESDGEAHEELAMSATDRARWWRVKQDAAAAGRSVEDLFAAGVRALGLVVAKSEPIETALDLWALDARDRKLRAHTIDNVKFAVGAFMDGRALQPVRDFTPADLVAWVAARYREQESRDTMLRRLLAFFRWCGVPPRSWCDVARFEKVGWTHQVLQDEKPTGYYTAAEMRAYLAAVPAKLKPAVATGFLLGVRPIELCRIQIAAQLGGEHYGFDEKRGHWRLPGEWTKTRKYRKLYALPDCWWYWWIGFKDTIKVRDRRAQKFVGRLVPMNYKNFRRALAQARESTALRQIDDGFRHSFGTHGYHRSADGKERGIEWCLAMIGHRGRLTVFSKHYDGKVDALEAEDYFLSYPDGAACDVKTRARIICSL